MGKTIRGGLYLGLVLLAAIGRSEARAQAAPGLTIQKDVMVNGKHCDIVTWTDSNGKQRQVSLVRAGGDTGGYSGGYIEKYSYYVDNTLKVGQSDATQADVSGLGCAVNHHDSGASSSKANSTGATTAFIFEGSNHCVWRFHTSTYSGAKGSVGLTIDWVISQGRNDILWVVSFDATGQPDLGWDSRGPYFQFDWDGDGQFYNGPISGIRWGDKYKFRTVAYNGAYSTWDYQTPNVVPYMMLYKNASIGDVEASAIQTQTWLQHDSAGYWWAASNWGKTGNLMPENFNCPYQLNAYEPYDPTNPDPNLQNRGYMSEKMAWGTNFGFVGNATYQRVDFATNETGTPHQGYATYIMINKYSQGLSDALIGSMEAVQNVTLTASKGTVVTSGPKHVNLSGTANYQPAGWNHVYGAWSVTCDGSNTATVNVNVASGTLMRPLFIFNNYAAATPPSSLSLGGATLTDGTDYSASVDTTKQQLWITLNRNLTGAANSLDVGSPGTTPPITPPPPGSNPPASSKKACGCGSATPSTGSIVWLSAATILVWLALRRPSA